MPTLPTNPSNKAVPAVSFERDILPLFRPMDIQCMKGLKGNAVFLADYAFMSVEEPKGTFVNALNVLSRLKPGDSPRMPYGGPYWSEQSIDLFQSWIDGGCKP
jgi:hypothetical protein